jgi:selenide,water dikinase
MGPGDLERLLDGLPAEDVPELLTSVRDGEDAGAYLLSERLAIVQTVDFFPPIVDDPRTFGRIAAANAMSDLYAMGASPLTAMNLVAWPCGLDLGLLEEILLGGAEKAREAGAVIVGGHTIEDDEPKYGMAVTGTVDPERMTTIKGARPGDLLVLTKPLGTGILATALKAGLVDEAGIAEAIDSMCALSGPAAEALSRVGVSACTDVTGFGLVGHLYGMARAGGVAAEIWASEVPLFERTLEMAASGMVPELRFKESEGFGDVEVAAGRTDPLMVDCLFDPQTSGGLLSAVDPRDARGLVEELRSGPCPRAAVIGRITEGLAIKIRIMDGRPD